MSASLPPQFAFVGQISTAVPTLLSHCGADAVLAVNFDSTSQIEFVLVNTNGSTTHGSNDGRSMAVSEPAGFVSLSVVNGLDLVRLGDTALMDELRASVSTA